MGNTEIHSQESIHRTYLLPSFVVYTETESEVHNPYKDLIPAISSTSMGKNPGEHRLTIDTPYLNQAVAC